MSAAIGVALRRLRRFGLPRAAAILLAGMLLLGGAATLTGRHPGRPAGGPGGAGGLGVERARHRGGAIAVGLLAPRSLDPALATRVEDQVLVGNLFDGLTALGPQGEVRPAVAASWSADPGLRHWVFRLRPGVTWSDGTPLQAADFKFAWERAARPQPAGAPAGPQPTGLGDLLAPVSGYRAAAEGRATAIAGLRVPDPATLTVDLDAPFADLPAAVANPRLSPLPRARVARNPTAYLAKPVGDGPFMLAAPPRGGLAAPPGGGTLLLVRNPRYYGAAPYLDRVEVDTFPDEQTAWLAFQDNLVDFAPVPLDQLDAARAVYGVSADGRSQPGVLAGPELATWYLGFNVHTEPFDDPQVRLAFSQAINRGRIAAALAGARAPAVGLVPTGVPGAAGALCAPCTYDPAQAKATFARLRPRPVTIQVPDVAVDRRIAALVVADLAAAGLRASVRVAGVDGYAAGIRRPGVQVFRYGWVADYPRMDSFLTSQFSSRGNDNLTGLEDPAVDGLLAQARATADDGARQRLYQQAEAEILAAVPVAPVLEYRHAAVLAPGLAGFDLTPEGGIDLAAISLAK